MYSKKCVFRVVAGTFVSNVNFLSTSIQIEKIYYFIGLIFNSISTVFLKLRNKEYCTIVLLVLLLLGIWMKMKNKIFEKWIGSEQLFRYTYLT